MPTLTERTFTPGAKTSTQFPTLAKGARKSEMVDAEAVIAFSAPAGEKEQASELSPPAYVGRVSAL